MERQVAKSFNNKVEAIIDDEADRDVLYGILSDYQRSHDLGRLILDLRNVINCPVRMSLYEHIRSLIPPKHQMDYDVLVPRYEVGKLRTIRLKRRNNEGIGFAVRGGLEHGIGLFVSHVVPDSQAQRQGLRVGDEIVRINGFTVRQAIHQEALGLVKTRRDIVMKVRNVGLLPVKEHPDEKLKWKYVENIDTEKALQAVLAGRSPSELQAVGTIVKLYVSIAGGSGLGCSICSGPADHPGIFIQSIKAGSLAQKAGLVVGDQILSVNDTSFLNVKHSEAVVALKSSRQLNMVLKRGAGLSLFGASGPLKTQEDKVAQQLREDAVVRDRVMEAADMMDDGHQITGRQVTIHIEDAQTREQLARSPTPPPPPPPPFVSQSSTLSSSASSYSPPPPPPPLVSPQPPVTSFRNDVQPIKPSHRVEPALHRTEINEKEELDRLKRDYLQTQSVQTPTSKPSPTRPLNVVTDFTPAHRHSASLSPSLLQEKPTFRFQKPVLLSPVRLDERSPTPSNTHSSITAPEKSALNEGEFNPTHLFTNEQIAGRKVVLVNILKSEQQELGVKLEEGRGANRGKVLIGEVRPNSAAHKQGGLDVGDQVMMVCGVPVVNYSFDDVVSIIDSLAAAKESIQLVVAKAPSHHMEEEITYF